MKRLLPLLLSLAMIASVFAGCGSPSASSAPADSVASSAAAPAPTEPAAPADESASFDSAAESASMEEPADGEDGWAYTPISYPLADTPATLDYWIIWELSPTTRYSDVSEHIALKELEDATGVHLNLLAQSQAAGQTNTNLMIASGRLCRYDRYVLLLHRHGLRH